MSERNGAMARQAKRLTEIVEALQCAAVVTIWDQDEHRLRTLPTDDCALIIDAIKYYAAAMLGVEIVTAEDAKRIVREQEEAERG